MGSFERHGLSDRQIEILQHLAEGRTRGQIALDMGISSGTVNSYIKLIFSRLQVRDRTSAIVEAKRLCLLS